MNKYQSTGVLFARRSLHRQPSSKIVVTTSTNDFDLHPQLSRIQPKLNRKKLKKRSKYNQPVVFDNATFQIRQNLKNQFYYQTPKNPEETDKVSSKPPLSNVNMFDENPKLNYICKIDGWSKVVFIALIIIGLFATIAMVFNTYLLIRMTTIINSTTQLPIGTIILYGGNITTLIDSTPRWLLCDGSEVSRPMYQDLFNVIGVTYGSGNSYDTFTLPDFRARFPLGSNDSNNESLVAGGASTHVLTVAEMPTHTHGSGSLQILSNGQHTHTYVDPGHNHGGSTGSSAYSSGTFAFVGGGGLGDDHGSHSHTISTDTTGITIQPDGSHTHVLQGITDSQGANQSIDMMPPYQTIHYIIQASKSTYFAPSNEKLIVILLFFLTMNLYIYKEECLSV